MARRSGTRAARLVARAAQRLLPPVFVWAAAFFALAAVAPPAAIATPAQPAIACPADAATPSSLAEVGRGKGVVFTPDFAMPGNRAFYQALGFAYFESASWEEIVAMVHAHNATAAMPVDTLVLETHGTNGHGLRLQRDRDPGSPRSYASVGALQELLAASGVRLCVLSACNSGRLLRPEIYARLDPAPGDPLFLPPTLGVLDASQGFHPAASEISCLRRDPSRIETAMEGTFAELPARVRTELGLGPDTGDHGRFVVSTMLIQMLLHDPALVLTAAPEWGLSRADVSAAESEALFQRLLQFLDAVASRV